MLEFLRMSKHDFAPLLIFESDEWLDTETAAGSYSLLKLV